MRAAELAPAASVVVQCLFAAVGRQRGGRIKECMSGCSLRRLEERTAWELLLDAPREVASTHQLVAPTCQIRCSWMLFRRRIILKPLSRRCRAVDPLVRRCTLLLACS